MNAVLALLLLASQAHAASEAGVTGAQVLQIPLGTRALGMGGAFTAVGTDSSALFYNPAGLARLSAHEVGFSFITGQADNSLNHFAYAGPLPFSGISGSGYASAGASLLMARSGEIEVNTLRSDGSLLASETISAGSDVVATLGYAERVGTSPLEFGRETYNISHFLGFSGKIIRSTLAERYTATAVAGDAGYLMQMPEQGLSVGVSVLNLGSKIKYVEEADPLPTTMRGGFAYQVGVPSVHTLILALDGDMVPKEKVWHVNTGMEYFWLKSYGLRLGYQFHRDTLGLTAGFGLRWRGRILIDYAWLMGDGLSDAHRVTLSYRFGGVAPSTRGRARRPFIETVPEKEQLRNLEQEKPIIERAPAPRPRRSRDQGVPGWIY
jgi:hypothetical protein